MLGLRLAHRTTASASRARPAGASTPTDRRRRAAARAPGVRVTASTRMPAAREQLGDVAADAAVADHRGARAGELAAERVAAGPAPRGAREHELGQAAREHHQRRHDVLGDRRREDAGAVGHEHAALRRSRPRRPSRCPAVIEWIQRSRGIARAYSSGSWVWCSKLVTRISASSQQVRLGARDRAIDPQRVAVERPARAARCPRNPPRTGAPRR